MQTKCAKVLCTHEHSDPRVAGAGPTSPASGSTPPACACWPTRCGPACCPPCGVGGPATATDLAAELGTNSGATSYHLRKLEAVGLVTDTGEGEGKRRLWRAATDFHSYYPSDFAGDEDSETALNWLARDYVRHFSTQAERWVDASPTWPTAWQDACGSSDDMVLLTAEQLSAMRDEIGEVVGRYRRVGQGNPDAKRIAVYLFAYALDLENGPAR